MAYKKRYRSKKENIPRRGILGEIIIKKVFHEEI